MSEIPVLPIANDFLEGQKNFVAFLQWKIINFEVTPIQKKNKKKEKLVPGHQWAIRN